MHVWIQQRLQTPHSVYFRNITRREGHSTPRPLHTILTHYFAINITFTMNVSTSQFFVLHTTQYSTMWCGVPNSLQHSTPKLHTLNTEQCFHAVLLFNRPRNLAACMAAKCLGGFGCEGRMLQDTVNACHGCACIGDMCPQVATQQLVQANSTYTIPMLSPFIWCCSSHTPRLF